MSHPLEQFDPRTDAAECSVTPRDDQHFRQTLLNNSTRVDAIYFHVPFCFHKCHYCDFYSIVDDPANDRQQAFTQRLIQELRLRHQPLHLRPDTIFVGGGTPTLLRPELWTQLLDAMDQMGVLQNVREFTVEANPETVTPQLASLLASRGVNRASIGTQSFNKAHLKTLERWHDPDNVARAADLLRQAGIDNINVDLIFGIPGQSLEHVMQDLDAALALKPDHISYYGLTYEPNTAMTKRLEMGQFTPCDETLEREMFAGVMARLDAAGFEQYELSNYARRDPARDRRCQHNLHYWRNDNWLGIGPAAASHVEGCRWKNRPHIGKYLASADEPPIVDLEHLAPDRRLGERLMLGLRLNEGLDLAWVESQLASPGESKRRAAIDYVCAIGMLSRADGRLRLTQAGRFVADAVIRELL